jgi:hypothetical protein
LEESPRTEDDTMTTVDARKGPFSLVLSLMLACSAAGSGCAAASDEGDPAEAEALAEGDDEAEEGAEPPAAEGEVDEVASAASAPAPSCVKPLSLTDVAGMPSKSATLKNTCRTAQRVSIDVAYAFDPRCARLSPGQTKTFYWTGGVFRKVKRC